MTGRNAHHRRPGLAGLLRAFLLAIAMAMLALSPARAADTFVQPQGADRERAIRSGARAGGACVAESQGQRAQPRLHQRAHPQGAGQVCRGGEGDARHPLGLSEPDAGARRTRRHALPHGRHRRRQVQFPASRRFQHDAGQRSFYDNYLTAIRQKRPWTLRRLCRGGAEHQHQQRHQRRHGHHRRRAVQRRQPQGRERHRSRLGRRRHLPLRSRAALGLHARRTHGRHVLPGQFVRPVSPARRSASSPTRRATGGSASASPPTA